MRSVFGFDAINACLRNVHVIKLSAVKTGGKNCCCIIVCHVQGIMRVYIERGRIVFVYICVEMYWIAYIKYCI